MTADPTTDRVPADDIQRAERWMRGDPRDRRRIGQAFAAAIVLHVVVLVARVPGWGPDPVRVDAPAQQSMQVEFLKPPAPATKAAPKPRPKAIPRPDPTPEEPEPIVEEPAPPPTASPATQPSQTGPVRVAPGQGPGLIKRVEPRYPPLMQAAQREGVVTLDAVIFTDGTVGDVKVLSSPHQSFADESVRAVEEWRV
jgi:protein TonB